MLSPQVNEGRWEGNPLCNVVLEVDRLPRITLGDTVSLYRESSQ